MKFIVLEKGEQAAWSQLDAVEVQDGLDLGIAQQLAVEQVAQGGGVFLAIPWEVWRLFRAEAQVTVAPVPRAGEVPTEERIEEFDDPELEGMTQGPKLA